MRSEAAREVAAFTHLLVDALVDAARLVPFADVGLDLGFHEGADFGAQGGVGFVEVGGVVLCM